MNAPPLPQAGTATLDRSTGRLTRTRSVLALLGLAAGVLAAAVPARRSHGRPRAARPWFKAMAVDTYRLLRLLTERDPR